MKAYAAMGLLHAGIAVALRGPAMVEEASAAEGQPLHRVT